MLARAAAPGMVSRGTGTIINVSGMLAFSGPASLEQLPLRRAVYTATLAHIVALSQVLHEELKPTAYGFRRCAPRGRDRIPRAPGTYHGVSKAQLQAYLDEFVFRHNRRRQPMAAF